MKLTRKTLLKICGGLGIWIVVYSLLRQFTGFHLGEAAEKYMMDVVIFSALGLFIYSRKMANDEKKAREAAEEAERRAKEEPQETAVVQETDENLPHWERYKNDADSGGEEAAAEDQNLPHWERYKN